MSFDGHSLRLRESTQRRIFGKFPQRSAGKQMKLPGTPFSRNFDSDFLVAVDFRVDRAAKEERHTPALVFVKM
jgi:hypothetical protein